MSALIRWYQGYFLAERPTGATIAELNWDTNPRSSINRLKDHQWKRNDVIHYATCAFFLTWAFFLNSAPFIFKTAFVLLMAALLLIPLTSQFFLNALPILTWVFFFFSSTTIPPHYRPPISVKVLPAVETIFYGDNLSQLTASRTAPALDILAWLPYGMIHFALPFCTAAMIFLWGPPTALRSFAFAFGYMNLVGVIVQLLFPAAAPWYKIIHGLDPANYSMLGSPGGLARIDALLGLDMYTTNFSKNSPVVFGAFPSLHSGSATMDALFLAWLFPKFKPLFALYVTWLWWSTMYLTHHYFVDLIAGSILSFVVFTYTKYTHLPINDMNAKNRWSYADIRKVNIFKIDPLASLYSIDEEARINGVSNTRARSGSIRQNFEMDVLNSTHRQRGNSLTTNFNTPTPQSIASQVAESIISNNNTNNPIASTSNNSKSSLNIPLPSSSTAASEISDSDVFEGVPRSYSRSSNTSIESQFDLGSGFVIPGTATKSRLD